MIDLQKIPKLSGIYKFINKTNNKCYIGQAVNLYKRIRSHLKNSNKKNYNTHLYLAIRKHGIENFEVEILIQNKKISNEILNDLEIDFIRLYNSFNSKIGYNMTEGGNFGQKSQEVINKIAKSNTGKIRSKETRKKLSESHLGHKHTEEQKQKIGFGNKGKIVSEETRQKLRRANTGKKHSEERRKINSESKKGHKLKPESIKKRQQTRKFNRNMKLIKENNFVYDWLF